MVDRSQHDGRLGADASGIDRYCLRALRHLAADFLRAEGMPDLY